MEIVTRQQWGARPPSSNMIPLGKVDTVFIHHSVTDPTGDPKADARMIQNYHMNSRGYSDIAYTLLAHPEGVFLEGRTAGSKAAIGAHTSEWNSRSIAICGVGNYQENDVPNKLIEAINAALAYAIGKGWVVNDPAIRPHSDVFATACCGTKLKARLKEIKPGGPPMSADAVTRDQINWMHLALYGTLPGPSYDYRHVGQPLHTVIVELFGPDPLANPNSLAAKVKAGQLVAPGGGCQSEIDAIYAKVKTAFGK